LSFEEYFFVDLCDAINAWDNEHAVLLSLK
jgi:hypothetical protein